MQLNIIRIHIPLQETWCLRDENQAYVSSFITSGKCSNAATAGRFTPKVIIVRLIKIPLFCSERSLLNYPEIFYHSSPATSVAAFLLRVEYNVCVLHVAVSRYQL